MSKAVTSPPPLPQLSVKLITCILPGDGADIALMKALRQERQVISATSIACRGISILQSTSARKGKLPEASLVRKVDVVVAADEAAELFDYIYVRAAIGREGGGTMFMGSLSNATLFELPEGIPDEATS